MRYLLVMGFACEVYRREPRVRIFVDDRLLDEFNISHTPCNTNEKWNELLKKSHILHPTVQSEINNAIISSFPPLKFYELQADDKINDLAIRIEINNNDNNYTNGYMTRSTLISLEVCAFFPLQTKLLQQLEKIKNRRRISKNYAWYRSRKNIVFDLAINGMIWHGKNGQKNLPYINNIYYKSRLGGDGVYVCKLTKKYGILITALARAYIHNFNYPIMNYFIDKYEQHANQRNTN